MLMAMFMKESETMIKLMDMESIGIWMGQSIQGSGFRISSMGLIVY